MVKTLYNIAFLSAIGLKHETMLEFLTKEILLPKHILLEYYLFNITDTALELKLQLALMEKMSNCHAL